MRFWIAATALLLAACGSREAAENEAAPAAPATPAGPRLGDVDLTRPVRATDAALTWSLEIAPGAISLTEFAGRGGDGKVADFYPVAPRVDANKAVYATKDIAGEAVTITLTRSACRENGEPAIERPLTAELKTATRTLTGCAGPRPADGLDSQPDNVVTTNAR